MAGTGISTVLPPRAGANFLAFQPFTDGLFALDFLRTMHISTMKTTTHNKPARMPPIIPPISAADAEEPVNVEAVVATPVCKARSVVREALVLITLLALALFLFYR